MHSIKYFLAITLLLNSIDSTYSQGPAVELSGTHVLKFRSVINKQDYLLQIELPGSYNKDTNQKYPVLYMLDGQWSFPVVRGINGNLHYDGFVPEMILVGVTWPDNYDANRFRDFTPTQIKEDSTSGGGPNFLRVLKNEVIRLIDSSFRTDPTDNTLIGGSFGGLFALYALFHEPTLFKHYIIGSPSLGFDDRVTFSFEKQYAAKHKELNATLFLHIGELEEVMDPTHDFSKLINQIKSHNYKGLQMDSFVVAKMSHSSSGPYAWARGLQLVFRKPELRLTAALLDQYKGHYKLFDDTLAISRIGNDLYIDFVRGKMLLARPKLTAETTDRFYVKGIQVALQFKKDENGKLVGFELDQFNNKIFVKKLD